VAQNVVLTTMAHAPEMDHPRKLDEFYVKVGLGHDNKTAVAA
jgi:hypothetical protein